MGWKEKRQYPRVPFQDFSWVFQLSLSSAPPEDVVPRFEAKDISQSGIKFVSNRKIPLFSEVALSLLDKTTGKKLVDLQGKVVRVEEIDTGKGEKNYGLALEFFSGQKSLAPFFASK